MRPLQLTTVLLSLSPLAAAWPSWLPEIDSLIVRRQDDSSSSSASPSETAAPSATTTSATRARTTNLNTGGRTQTETATTTGDGGNSTASTTATETERTTFNAQDPAGGIVMTQPATTVQGSQLYKIGDQITFGWNYTNLQGTPTALDVLVSCSKNSATWTLTQNMTFETAGGSYTWDTESYQETANPQLLVEEYTLIIYDAESSISATAEPGYLSAFEGFTFGMYTGKPYTPLASGWQCATCSGAVSDMEKRALGFALTMAAITVASFTWFVTGLW